jgi:hypothetical protein
MAIIVTKFRNNIVVMGKFRKIIVVSGNAGFIRADNRIGTCDNNYDDDVHGKATVVVA